MINYLTNTSVMLVPLFGRFNKSRILKGYAIIDNKKENVSLFQYSWSLNYPSKNSGYAIGWVDGKRVKMHRLIINAKNGLFVDHKNGNGLDNRLENLRECTHWQNAANRHKKQLNPMFETKKSKYLGVHFIKPYSKYCSHGWKAQVMVNGKQYTNQSKKVREDDKVAAFYRDILALKYFGEFAVLNFPENKEEYIERIKNGDIR